VGHGPGHTVVQRVAADRHARQGRLAAAAAPCRPAASRCGQGMVISPAGPERLRLLATDGFLVDGFMHLAEVGTASGVTVAVTVVPHTGESCLLATDGFLIDGFMHVAEVGTPPEVGVA